MFIETLFIISKTWPQLICPSIGEWINELWYTQTMQFIQNNNKKGAIKSQKDKEES